jgi:cytochrome b involved in lipid metabolism
MGSENDKYYQWEEIEKHNTVASCWLVAHNKVYDVTAFITKHPAGKYAILKHAGSDVTQDFDFHSSNGQKQWRPFKIGVVKS